MFFEEMMYSYWNKKAGKKKGFTLVEMLVVIAIVAVLTSIIIPTFKQSTLKAAAATNAANLRAAKGEFTTLKLLNPTDYSAMLSGFNKFTGITANDNEEFEVQGTDETVTAADAVEMKTDEVTVAKGTKMNAQIIKNEYGHEEVYVTYNGLPIAYFAEIAEKGEASANYYREGAGNKGAGNVAANKEYVKKYQDRVTSMLGGMTSVNDKKHGILDKKTLYGELLTEMQPLIDNPETYGDCMKCALNNNVNIMGSDSYLLDRAGWFVDVEGMLNSKLGYTYTPNKTNCTGYTPGSSGVGCVCDPSHGPDAHISMTDEINMGAGIEECKSGGFHVLDHNHKCSQCGESVHMNANGTPDHQADNLPYVGALINDQCMYCGYCACCASGKYKEPIWGVDAGVCMTLDPLTGGAKEDYGCGHPRSSH